MRCTSRVPGAAGGRGRTGGWGCWGDVVADCSLVHEHFPHGFFPRFLRLSYCFFPNCGLVVLRAASVCDGHDGSAVLWGMGQV